MKHQYQVGEMVRIRDWNDMEKEFGIWHDYIETPGWFFTQDMKELCGNEYKIASIEPQPDFYELDLHFVPFHITDAMVVPAGIFKERFSVDDWNSLMGVV